MKRNESNHPKIENKLKTNVCIFETMHFGGHHNSNRNVNCCWKIDIDVGKNIWLTQRVINCEIEMERTKILIVTHSPVLNVIAIDPLIGLPKQSKWPRNKKFFDEETRTHVVLLYKINTNIPYRNKQAAVELLALLSLHFGTHRPCFRSIRRAANDQRQNISCFTSFVVGLLKRQNG